MSLDKLSYSKDWTNPTDFPTVETDEAQVRADQQLLYDEIKTFLNTKLIPAAKAFQAIIKGTMTDWKASEKMSSEGDTLSFNYTFAENDEFGFAWYDETTTTSYGNWIGIKCLGTTGTANSFFAGENNFKCSKAGTYNIKIVKDGADKVTVDFYNI